MPLLYRARVARSLALAAGAYLIYYLGWRATATLNHEALAFSLLLLAAEVLGAVVFALFVFTAWDIRPRAARPAAPGLAVDVCLLARQESPALLEATLVGCEAIVYPHTTSLVDASYRPAVEQLTRRFGCRYLVRDGNGPGAGLRTALAATTGEYVVVLEGHMVPQPDLLGRTLGHFADERVAVVQLPPEFYNLDALEAASPDGEARPWHDEVLASRVVQPGKDRWNAAVWCGAPSIVRRAALEAIGGPTTDPGVEDLQTSIRLHAGGWQTVYHAEPLAFGSAPVSLDGFIDQRLRGARTTVRLLRGAECPLMIGGLTFPQRLCYLASVMPYFAAYQQLIYLATPATILLSGVLPIRLSGTDFLPHWLPYFLLGNLAWLALGRGHFNYLRVEQYKLLKMFAFIWASLTLNRARSAAAPADHSGRPASVWAGLAPHLAVLGFVVVTTLVAVTNLFWGFMAVYASEDAFLLALSWAVSTALLLLVAIHAVIRRRSYHRRQSYRFATEVRAGLTAANGHGFVGTTHDLSRDGVGLLVAGSPDVGAQHALTMHLPDGPLLAPTEVVYNRPLAAGLHRIGLRFVELQPADRLRLLRFLYVTLPRWRREPVAAGTSPVPLGAEATT